MLRSVAVLAMLLAAPAALAGPSTQPTEAPVRIEKKVKAKKLRKALLGSWRIHPVDEPELSQWLSGMASLDMTVDEVVQTYRLSNETAARLEIEKAKSPPKLPAELQQMLAEGVTVTFTDDGTMSGSFGGESMQGTWSVVQASHNRLEISTMPEDGKQDVIVMQWIDKDRVVWSNKSKDGRLRAARIE